MQDDIDAQVAAMRVVLRDVEQLTPYAHNSRTHSATQIGQIAASIREFGFTNPVLLDGEDGIVAGHGRVLAALSLGLKRIPTIDLGHLTEVQRRAYVLADNKLALNAGWDLDMLRQETDALVSDGFDLGLTGFSTDELAEMFADLEAPSAERDPDDAPGRPTNARSKPGDLWLLGPHRVLCGDSTSSEAWAQLMGKERADCCWTDPPYNVAIGDKNAMLDRADKGNRGKTGGIANDKMGDAAFRTFLCEAFGCVAEIMKPGAAIYVAHADTEGLNFRAAFLDAGLKLSGCLIWRKDMFVIGRSDFQWQHEPILYGWKPGSAHRWYGGRKQTTIVEHGAHGPIRQLPDGRWAVTVGDDTLIVDGQATLEQRPGSVIFHEKPRRSDAHPTMKPVGLVEKFLRFSARSQDVVVDAFGGSGTTLIAAERMGMCARLMELDPSFVDVIVRRWCEYTGRSAQLAGTDETWDGVER